MISVKLPDQSAIIRVMQKAVIKASRGLLRDFSELEKLQVSIKDNKTFVSSADRRSDSILRDELLHARPDFSLISEETEAVFGANPEYRWIIDPLDGTTNYLHGFPHWAISVALEKKGVIVAAVTYDPLKNEMFWAEKGCGAYVNDQKIRVSSKREFAQILVSFSTMNQLPKFSKLCPCIRRTGCTTLDMAYVAAGRLDLLCMNPGGNPWDISAGALLVKEAGGVLCDKNGRSVSEYSKLELMANIDLVHSIAKLNF